MYLFYGMFTDIFGACGLIVGSLIILVLGLIALVVLGITAYAVLAIVVATFRESHDWIKKKLRPNKSEHKAINE